ncbi:4'-phosphopantetheinyl transferase superfamily protein [Streptomyces sp. WAC05374]|uniref:4'-phosphopantetheinyl transferase family protein n=1 Tax=Streptomyces sp. WAC05374 TaxID=2487420 RepID=UPI000F88E995|nr:4'-phosphopantetheinyl transferase superfamily protein [Streptomyces sp. WAC05374]RST19078.1 4'-phosphopantetheinyl transferase superfamily protein [Streptomyces sp. WAC05374]TDF36954.1 4'-phosphopantetheinyl transferase superfamily protein [Streptomyces sp. WAC05374]TDF46449.1 4'-phosphopantetheinyl transferase superfamily protein [Streptomyces sp. WAC05374]TDF47550.1 4'-phosphopantetheinyl transferase superfamily protein [Streptomyces sp. WAC05374]
MTGSARLDAWLVDLDAADAARLVDHRPGALTEEEARRLASFENQEAARRFLRTRRTVRHLVAEWLGLAPPDVRIAHTPTGKPYLPDHPGRHISWSRSDGLLLLCAAADGPIGVDVELIRPVPSALDVLSFVVPDLPPEAGPESFFPAWTLLEAAVKATGQGLARGAKSVNLTFSTGGGVALRGIAGHAPGTWHARTTLLPAAGLPATAMASFVAPMALDPVGVRRWPVTGRPRAVSPGRLPAGW